MLDKDKLIWLDMEVKRGSRFSFYLKDLQYLF
ncbi:hypothetical protein SHEWT2_04164 [Shewanella hafniensis]|nr:hypothetical protein SHEWT2_04164 [Shewanella hafniensis]